MKKLIMIIMYLTFCVPIIWTQTHQIKDAIQIGSVKENNLDTSLVVNVTKEQVQDLVINSYLSKVLLVILCVVVGVLYYLYSRLSIRNREYENEAYVMKRCVKRLEQNVQDCSSRVDYMHRRVKESIGSEIDSTISDVKDEKTKENLKSENIQSTLEEADLSDIIGYAEYLGKQKMRLFNSPNSETIYIIKKGENRHGVCFIVDSTNVQKAIKNKTVCLDPLCNIIKGSQQSAIDIKTINPGIVQLEQGNIYKVIEKANIELIS